MTSDTVVYENAQWRLLNNGDNWFFEQVSNDGTQPYWCYVFEVMEHDYSITHVADKMWCNVELWGDVCRKAVELSPWKPGYDLEEQLKVIAKRKTLSIEEKISNGAKAIARKARLLKPSELSDLGND